MPNPEFSVFDSKANRGGWRQVRPRRQPGDPDRHANYRRPPAIIGSRLRQNAIVVFRRHLIDLLSDEPRSVSSVARELGLRRGDIEDDLRHALRSAMAAGHRIEIIPARCKDCGFVFADDRLVKPGRCPSCKGTRLFEPLLRIERRSTT